MNPGAYSGITASGQPITGITRYIQTPTILTSQTIAVPPGTKRIEALLVGGGGGGANSNLGGGGGFGGAAVIEIPVTGAPLEVVIGAGGTSQANGSPTYIISAGTRYAEVGGGGAGNTGASPNSGYPGRSGGGGGGCGNPSADVLPLPGGLGGPPPIGKLLWSIYPNESHMAGIGLGNYPIVTAGRTAAAGAGQSFLNSFPSTPGAVTGGGGGNGSLGGGGSGGTSGKTANAPTSPQSRTAGIGGYGGGGGGGGPSSQGSVGNFGGGGGGFAAGGSLINAPSIWGYNGFAGGNAGPGLGGGGGGGLLGAGTTPGPFGGLGGSGGLGGGGGGARPASPGGGGGGGTGGQGFAAIRFYL